MVGMKDKITKFSDNQPHLTVLLIDESAMVVPVRYIEEIIDGTQDITINDENKMFWRSIVKQWYEEIKRNR